MGDERPPTNRSFTLWIDTCSTIFAYLYVKRKGCMVDFGGFLRYIYKAMNCAVCLKKRILDFIYFM